MDLEKLITAKLGVLELTRKQIEASLEDSSDRNERDLEKKLRSREAKIDEINDLIIKVQENKLVEGEIFEDVESWATWGNEITEKTKVHELTLRTMQSELEIIRRVNKEKSRKSQVEEENLKIDQAIEEEKKLQKAKLQIRKEYEQTSVGTSAINNEIKHQPRIKLPKLVIAKFDGSHTDFLRFWNTFTEEIDKTAISATSKFSYLKELLGTKQRTQIDGLPFSTEGYNRAKTILENKYGQTSEIESADDKRYISITNTRIFRDFSKKCSGVTNHG